MTENRGNPVVLNLLVIAVTIVFVATALIVGRPQSEEPPTVAVGDFASERVEAPFFIQVVDQEATDEARNRAAINVRPVYFFDPSVNADVDTQAQRFLAKVENEARLTLDEFNPDDIAPDEGTPDAAEPPTAEFAVECTELACQFDASSSSAAETAQIETYTWDFGDGEIGSEFLTAHSYAEAGSYFVTLSVTDNQGETDSTSLVLQLPTPEGGEITTVTEPPVTTTVPPTTTTLPLRDREEHLARVASDWARLGGAVDVFVDAYREDTDRAVAGEPLVYPRMADAVRSQIADRLAQGITEAAIDNVKNDLALNPPSVFLNLSFIEDQEQADAYQSAVNTAVADVVGGLLEANQLIDDAAWEEQQQAAADSVDDVLVQFPAGAPIVEVGSRIGEVQFEALTEAGYLEPAEGDSRLAVAAVGAIAVLLTAFFLWRIAPSQWSEPRRFALLGVLLVLAALASRVPEIVAQNNELLGYTIPAVMFGYMAAILYDPRTAVLTSVPVAVFTAVSTGDAALTIYAGAATVAPVAFVSAVSSRRDLRVAVALSAAVLAPLAASIAWLFTGASAMWEAALFAIIGGVVAGLVAQGLLSFLENQFRVTTTITLLDLTDRNHPALRLIEEQAPGTFNHSILVGTLAGKAARAIGADPLLAQAAAFYHDLGKTKQPQFFIENQFGVSNPHDALPPEESAEIISDHVTEGLRLARQFRLPPEVVNGIRMHHGTGLMRYFYHKALEDDPGVDPNVYRHRGEKPKAKEMAILMIADACEGAARALAQQEDPTGDSLRKLVDSIVGEKLEDGQLDESDLTYGDLTKVKLAIVEALIGYYHTRIPYPGFPGPRVEAS